MKKRTRADMPLIFIIVLLLSTVTAFVAGLFPYPFGVVILGIALLGRMLQIRNNE